VRKLSRVLIETDAAHYARKLIACPSYRQYPIRSPWYHAEIFYDDGETLYTSSSKLEELLTWITERVSNDDPTWREITNNGQFSTE
jgi:hypothetical protein